MFGKNILFIRLPPKHFLSVSTNYFRNDKSVLQGLGQQIGPYHPTQRFPISESVVLLFLGPGEGTLELQPFDVEADQQERPHRENSTNNRENIPNNQRVGIQIHDWPPSRPHTFSKTERPPCVLLPGLRPGRPFYFWGELKSKRRGGGGGWGRYCGEGVGGISRNTKKQNK